MDSTTVDLLDKYSNRILPYSPDNPNLAMRLPRGFRIRIAVICEVIGADKIDQKRSLNQQKILGTLYAAVANPMPQVSPGSSWIMSIYSEDFGQIDSLKITITTDLEEREPLGENSMEVLLMPSRPPCLLDIDHISSTWPLRFNINDCEIQVKRSYPKQIAITKPGKNGLCRKIRLAAIWKRVTDKVDSSGRLTALWKSRKIKTPELCDDK